LIGSLRGVGYSLETAVADLIDNSVAAGASLIDIRWDWNDGNPTATILDNGRGMDEQKLVEAMRFGGAGPDGGRADDDLGRFGLGLKTASLSQCRCVVVVSKAASALAGYAWDLDHVREAGDQWELLALDELFPQVAAPDLADRNSGTAVLWRKVDFGRAEDRPDHAAFMADLERLEGHLGMVFHRFLSGDARQIKITLNGRRVVGWDPFLETHEATIPTPAQSFNAPGGRIKARGFVLPHRDRFQTVDDFERAGGPEGWTAQQGFYVYRQKRLLSAGGWLGLGGSRAWTREEASRLARIRVDIPNTADHDWRIDIRKAIARPPDAIRKNLQRLAESVRTKAREVFVHRGSYGPRPKGVEFSRIWQAHGAEARRRYTLKRDHPLVSVVRDALGEPASERLDQLLDQIERTVPVDRVWLDVSESGAVSTHEDTDELIDAGVSMTQMLMRTGLTFDAAATAVAGMEPFDTVDNLIAKIAVRLGAERP
jgi:hypothetical protein